MGSIAHSFLLSLIHRSDMTKILFERIYSSNSSIHSSPEESIIVSLSYIKHFIVILYKIFFLVLTLQMPVHSENQELMTLKYVQRTGADMNFFPFKIKLLK